MKTEKVKVVDLSTGNMFLFLGAIWKVDEISNGHLGSRSYVDISRLTSTGHDAMTWTRIEGDVTVEVILNCPPESKWKGRIKSFLFKVFTSPALYAFGIGIVFNPSLREIGLMLFMMSIGAWTVLKVKENQKK